MMEKGRYVICGTSGYGLYCGRYLGHEVSPDGSMIVQLGECRHIAHWHGRTGGITSLARWGICGPRAAQSRIGGPTTEPSLLASVRTIFPCSDEARVSFESAVQS